MMIPPDIFSLGQSLTATYGIGESLTRSLPTGSIIPGGYIPAGSIAIRDVFLRWTELSFEGFYFYSPALQADLLFLLGTHDILEWTEDLDFIPTQVRFPDGRFHTIASGFNRAFDGIHVPGFPSFTAFLGHSRNPLTIVAHSLGSSIGIIAARWAIALGRVVRLVAFAPPRTADVTLLSWVNTFITPDSAIVINVRDVVPYLPCDYPQLSSFVYHFDSDLLGVAPLPIERHHMPCYLAGVSSLGQPMAKAAA